jgi:hypothetical protein
MDSTMLKFVRSAQGKFCAQATEEASVARGSDRACDTCTIGQPGSGEYFHEHS